VGFAKAVAENGYILQGSAATLSKMWWATWHEFCCKFLGEYNSGRIL